MIYAFLIDAATGVTQQRIGVPSAEMLDASAYGEGKAFVLFDPAFGDIEDFETAITGEDIAVVARVFDPTILIANKRIVLHAAVKAARDVHEQAGCTTPSGQVDTDADSQRKVGGAATMALALGASFTMDWRMKDNSIVRLDASGMIALGEAVAEHVAACQARKNALDAAIDAATTLDELAAIDPEQGWPSLQ